MKLQNEFSFNFGSNELVSITSCKQKVKQQIKGQNMRRVFVLFIQYEFTMIS